MRVRGGVSNLLLLALSVGTIAAGTLLPGQKAPKLAPVNFSRDILPILSDKCFNCHGPDAGSRKVDLRLDTPEGAFANRSGRFPIVPGKPQDSLVVKKINDPVDPMPLRTSGKSLTPQEMALITRWIAEGAHYGKLWSFNPLPGVVPVPAVKSSWPRNDIDRFILARLTKEGLSPSRAASPQRWLRRVTYDLTGLPPTEQEISAFRGDKKPGSYERVVDRLLASPHYGERIAVDWLDAARYSDSYGYQSDLIMPAWPYRDWVVKAFNENLPYNRFLIDQLAGDELPNPTRDERLATCFNRLHRQSNEGGSIALEYQTEYAVDRVNTFGTAVLGLTLGCARCHDHKFDPISQKEFYQLYAYFNSIDEYGLLLSTEIVPTPSLLLPTLAQESKLRETRAADELAKQRLRGEIRRAEGPGASNASPGHGPASHERLDGSDFAKWLAEHPAQPVIPNLLCRFSLDKEDGGKYANEVPGKVVAERIGEAKLVPGRSGNALLLDGDNGVALRGLPGRERWDAFTWSFWVKDPRAPIHEILMHRTGGTDVGFCGFDMILEDGYLTARVMRTWPGNAVAVRTKTRLDKDAWEHVAWSWDGSGHASGLKIYLNGKVADTVVLSDTIWKKINAYGDLGPSRGDWSFGQRFREAGFKGGQIDDLAFADRALSPIEVAQLFDGHSLSDALKSQGPELREYYASAFDPQVKAAREAVKKSQIDLTNAEEPVYEVEVMQDAPREVPAYLLARGLYDAPRNASTLVHRGVPKVLPGLNEPGANNRLALARWATSPNHPLTSRVAVNRLWQMIFGTGLVETSENFGMQGSRPTHPELLDYLARRFVNSGWNVKSLLRDMVLSATYRQDSVHSAKLNKVDPQNKLYARGPSERLSAEMVRDTALFASGLLNAKVGGEPVNPYQPAGIWTENNTMSPGFVQSKGADLYRRSLYSTWKRTTPVPNILLFDATSRESCEVRRPTTSTPMQALVLLNDVQFVEAARVLAEDLLKQPGTDQSRIRSAFVRLAGREPDAQELAILLQVLKEQRDGFTADPSLAAKLVKVGDSKPSESLPPVELAAMSVTVQTVMSSDAVVWKR